MNLDDTDDSIAEMEFKCPKCGSAFFGSNFADPAAIVRYCHGHGCAFTWSIADDALYFHPTGRRIPRTFRGGSLAED